MKKLKRNLIFERKAFQDILFWIENDPKKIKRIFKLIDQIIKTPFEGLGKPEMLKGDLSGLWSRRIDQEHRLIYSVNDIDIKVLACRFHYKE